MTDSNISELIISKENSFVNYLNIWLKERVGLETNLVPENITDFFAVYATKLNLFVVDKLGKSKIGVEALDNAHQFAYTRPNLAKISLLLIPSAELLTIQAQNKLLKLLEEPPIYLKIFLQAERADRLLITVRSRVITTNLHQEVKPNLPDELLEIAALTFSTNKEDLKELYTKLNQGLVKLKSNQEQKQLLNDFISIITIKLQDYMLKHTDSFENTEKINSAMLNLKKSIDNNGNIKLSVDRLFMDLL